MREKKFYPKTCAAHVCSICASVPNPIFKCCSRDTGAGGRGGDIG